jgi:cytochrome c551/c552
VTSVSCGAVGACAAGGRYKDGSGHEQAFVASETNGSWGNAVEVPGTGALNTSGSARVSSVSCAAAGACAAGGIYKNASGRYQAFLVNETKGSWGNAVALPGAAALSSTGSGVYSVSCGAVGACTAGGYYTDGSFVSHAFVISETNGSWGDAVEVPGTATLNSGGTARLNSVSCRAAGACTAGGNYLDGSGHTQAFVVTETNGSWGDAVEVPGTATLNSGGYADVTSVSCGAVGACAAVGRYRDGSGHDQAFVAGETNGSWGDAIEVPGTAALNSTGDAVVNSVSCRAAGACTAGGFYFDASGHAQAFVVDSPLPCIVPKVVGKPLSAAKKRLTAAHCGVGKITKVYSKVKKGRVAAQSPRPGKHLKAGARVALRVSKGKRP